MQGYCNSESRWRTGPWAARAQPPGTSCCWVGGKDNSQDEGRSQEKPIQACHGDSQWSVDGGCNGCTLSKPAKTSEPCQSGKLHHQIQSLDFELDEDHLPEGFLRRDVQVKLMTCNCYHELKLFQPPLPNNSILKSYNPTIFFLLWMT